MSTIEKIAEKEVFIDLEKKLETKIFTPKKKEITVNRAFKGVWIPKEIWLDINISWIEKLFLVEISSLDNESGCFASNDYFSNFFALSKQRCSQVIKELERKGYLKIRYEIEGKQIKKRVLNIIDRGIKYSLGGIKKINGGYQEKLKDNNTINNTINNIDKDPYIIIDKDNISSLNKKLYKDINNDNISISLKEKEEEEKRCSAAAGLIVKAYPTQTGGRSTQRSVYDKKKLKALVKQHGADYIIEVINLYVKSQNGEYLKNFKTFINQFPSKDDFASATLYKSTPPSDIQKIKNDYNWEKGMLYE